MLPLLLDQVNRGHLTLEQLVERLDTNPRRIFGLPPADTTVEVDPDAEWVIRAAELHTGCDWTPFEGRRLTGRVTTVRRGDEILYDQGKVLATPGSGVDLRKGKR